MQELKEEGFAIGATVTDGHICVYHYGSRAKFTRSSVAEANPFPDLGEGVWWISRVLVQRHERGRGIGSRLLARLVLEIKGKGGKAIVVAPGGYSANHNRQIHFYEMNGFKQVGSEGLYRMELQDAASGKSR